MLSRCAKRGNLPATVMTANHVRRARWFLSASCAALALVSNFVALPQAAFARTSTHFEALPLVRSRQNHLLVRAFINGRPAWLTVDSGAPVSVIALNRRRHFRLTPITADSNLPARVQINGGFNNVAIARELRIGGLILENEPVVTVDLEVPRAQHEWRTNRRSMESLEQTSFFRPKRCWIVKSSYLFSNPSPTFGGAFPDSIGAGYALFQFRSATVTTSL